MDKTRRDRLRAVRREVERARSALESIREEEDEVRGNIPENLQYSDRYEESEKCSEAMEEAESYLADAIKSIEEAL